MGGVKLYILALILTTSVSFAQPKPETQDNVFKAGDILEFNMRTAIESHQADDPNFGTAKQQPEDKRTYPPFLVTKNNLALDWTPGQHARYLMEQFRQGLHVLRSAEKLKGMDAGVIEGIRDYWPKLRDISCKDAPGTLYYDLDGIKQYCSE